MRKGEAKVILLVNDIDEVLDRARLRRAGEVKFGDSAFVIKEIECVLERYRDNVIID
jgi:hypothetical protein